MNATQLTLAGSLMELATGSLAADHLATGDLATDDVATDKRALSHFRRLLDVVWEENEARLAGLAVGLGLRRDQAADALQDVYLMAIQKPPVISEATELVQWLFRVTVNRCHLDHRRRGRWQRFWSSLAVMGRARSGP